METTRQVYKCGVCGSERRFDEKTDEKGLLRCGDMHEKMNDNLDVNGSFVFIRTFNAHPAMEWDREEVDQIADFMSDMLLDATDEDEQEAMRERNVSERAVDAEEVMASESVAQSIIDEDGLRSCPRCGGDKTCHVCGEAYEAGDDADLEIDGLHMMVHRECVEYALRGPRRGAKVFAHG